MTLIQTLNNKLREQYNKKHKGSGKISPSLLGSCWMRQYWNRIGEPKTDHPDDRGLRIMSVGKKFHEWIEEFFPDCETEVKVETIDIKGFADIVTDSEVIDAKSVHSGKFTYLTKGDITVSERTSILQCACYAHLLDKPIFKLIYMARDDMRIEEYAFYTDQYRQKVLDELETLRGFPVIPPPRKPRAYKDSKDGTNTECKTYCSWRTKCRGENNGHNVSI